MNDKRKMIYYCLQCDGPFEVKQGSRRQYCDKCLLSRIKGGVKIEKEGKPNA